MVAKERSDDGKAAAADSETDFDNTRGGQSLSEVRIAAQAMLDSQPSTRNSWGPRKVRVA